MEFGDFIKIFAKYIKGYTQPKLVAELFFRADKNIVIHLDDEKYNEKERVKKWISGNSHTYIELFKNVNFDDVNFIQFLEMKTKRTWKKIQSAFKDISIGEEEIDFDTDNIDIFYTSVLWQFKEFTEVLYRRDTVYDDEVGKMKKIDTEQKNNFPVNYVHDYIESGPLSNTKQYLEWFRKERKIEHFNELTVYTTQTFNILEKNNNKSDAKLIYNFEGINTSNYKTDKFIMAIARTLLSADKDFKFKATVGPTKENVFCDIIEEHDDRYLIGIPFFGNGHALESNEPFKLNLEVYWEECFEWKEKKGKTQIYLADPLNYSRSPSDGSIRINFLFDISDREIYYNYYFRVYKSKRNLDWQESDVSAKQFITETEDNFQFIYERKCIDDSLFLIEITKYR